MCSVKKNPTEKTAFRRFDAPHDIFKDDEPDLRENALPEKKDAHRANAWKERKDTNDVNASREHHYTNGADAWREGKDAYDAWGEGKDAHGADGWREGKDANGADGWREGKDAYGADGWREGKDAYGANAWNEGEYTNHRREAQKEPDNSIRKEPGGSNKANSIVAKPATSEAQRPLVQMVNELIRADEQASGKWSRYCCLENRESSKVSDWTHDPAACTDQFIHSFFTALQQNAIPDQLECEEATHDANQLFVTHLLPEFTEEDVRTFFETTFGEVKEIIWKQLRNFCFITMASTELTTKVLLNRHSIYIQGHRVILRRAQNRRHPLDLSAPEQVRANTKWGQDCSEDEKEEVPDISAATRIFVGHLPRGTVEEDLRQYFSSYGEILRIEFTEKKGYGFVTFLEKEAVDEIIKWEENHAIGNQWVQCTRSPYRDGPSAKYRAQKRQDADRWKGSIFDSLKGQKGLVLKDMGANVESELFLGGLPHGCQTFHIEEAFKAFGEISKIDLKLSKGYAFIAFSEPDTHVKVLQFNGHIQVGGETIDVKTANPRKSKRSRSEMRERLATSSRAFDDANSPSASLLRAKRAGHDDGDRSCAKRAGDMPATCDLRLETSYRRAREREPEGARPPEIPASSSEGRSWNVELSPEKQRSDSNWIPPERSRVTRQSAELHWDTSAKKTDFTAFI